MLATALVDGLRRQRVLLPTANVIERVCAEAITRANRRIHAVLTEALTNEHRLRLDELLQRKEGSKSTRLGWLRQSAVKPNSRHMREHIDRLKAWQALDLPAGVERQVHQNRLLKIARDGGQMAPADLAKFEPQRRYATLVALAIEGTAAVTDEIIDLHDRIIGKLFAAAKNKHQQQLQASGKAINDKVRLYARIGQALLDAKEAGGDTFAAIEAVMPWEDFAASVTEAQRLAQPEGFDFLHRIGESYATLRRYAPEFLDVRKLRAAPAAKGVLDAIKVLRTMNADNARAVPPDASTAFIKLRWAKLVLSDAGIDRRYYELCSLSELKNALRSGDVWVHGSRQFKDFDEYLVPAKKFPARGFAGLDEARAWASGFVHWYNVEHRHSAIGYVSPAQRHASEDTAILAARHSLYMTSRALNPARWSGPTRNWSPVGPVTLNPERDCIIKAHVESVDSQSLAA